MTPKDRDMLAEELAVEICHRRNMDPDERRHRGYRRPCPDCQAAAKYFAEIVEGVVERQTEKARDKDKPVTWTWERADGPSIRAMWVDEAVRFRHESTPY